MLCAPHGGGKTTALIEYTELHRDVGITTLPQQASGAQVTECLGRLTGARLMVVDQADAASPAGHEALFASIEQNWPSGMRYLLSGASRIEMRVATLLGSGIAAMLDASVLPFSSAEIAELASAQGVAADEIDLEQLHYLTDGWPVAVAWIIRDTARNGRSLRGAFEQWRELNGHLLLEFVTAAHDAQSAEAFVSAIWSLSDPVSQRALERLDAAGYPIVRMRTGLRPYRVLARIAADMAEAGEPPVDKLILNLFGRFSCTVADRTVAFGRRRDQNVLAYVALAPYATVTRAELLETFWPNAPRAVASQGLRTALYRLRRALSDAGGLNADRYLRIDDSITLDLDWVTIDAREFRDDVKLAQTEGARGNHRAALEHYLHAERLYTGALLASEALEPTLANYAAEYCELFKLVLESLVASYAGDGNATLRSTFQARRQALSTGGRH